MAAYASNRSGGRYSTRGIWPRDGGRYCPTVTHRQPASYRSRNTAATSSSVSPSPTMIPDLSGSTGRIAAARRMKLERAAVIRSPADRRRRGAGRSPRCGRGCRAPASTTVRSDSALPAKSGTSSSTVAPGELFPQRPHGGREMRRPAVRKVVPRDRRHDDVPPAELRRRARHPVRLGGVRRRGHARRDAAEGAAPRAAIPQQDHGGGPGPPALPHVGAPRVAAHRPQAVPLQDAGHLRRLLAGGHPDLEPLRPPLPGRSRESTPGAGRRRKRPPSRTASIEGAHPFTSAIEVASRPLRPQRWILRKKERSVVTFSAKPW